MCSTTRLGWKRTLAEQRRFLARGVGEEGERLVAVAGEDDLVETLGGSSRRVDLDVVAAPANPAHRRRATYVGESGRDPLDVDASAARNGAPLRPTEDPQQPMVVAEAHQRGQREVEDVAGWGGPDRGRHRQ